MKRFDKCFWCKKEFKSTSHNLVYIGGHGEVYGCDKCLDLVPTGIVSHGVAGGAFTKGDLQRMGVVK